MWLSTEYLVDKWRNQSMDNFAVLKYFCPLSVDVFPKDSTFIISKYTSSYCLNVMY